MRWQSYIFNCNACVYQTATRWDLPPYPVTIWLIDWWSNICLFIWRINSRFLLQRFWHWKPVDLNPHRQSPLYSKQTDWPSVLVLRVTKIVKQIKFKGTWGKLEAKDCFQIQSWKKYLRQTSSLVFMWNRALRRKFNF